MSISGILSGIYNQSHLSGPGSNYRQQIHQLNQDLKSGNLSAAQSDFATLQKALAQSATTTGSPSGTATNPATLAFNQFLSDLRSGNLPSAQKDISAVQQALHESNGTGSANHIGQSLSSGNLSSAQQAYVDLQQQIRQIASGSGALSTQSPVSVDA